MLFRSDNILFTGLFDVLQSSLKPSVLRRGRYGVGSASIRSVCPPGHLSLALVAAVEDPFLSSDLAVAPALVVVATLVFA